MSTPVLDAVPDAVLVVMSDGSISYANNAAAELFALSVAELTHSTVEDLIPAELRHVHEQHRRAFVAAPVRRQMGTGLELSAVRADGRAVPVDIALSPVEVDGTMCTIASIRDISVRKQSEAELAAARERLAILDDRERIARDLHDTIIQEVFAAGLAIETVVASIDDPQITTRLDAAAGRLETTITRLRNVIFDLRRPDVPGDLATALEEVMRNAAGELGFDARLAVEGDLDDVPTRVAEHLVPTVREALMNVAKHADASALDVSVEVGDELTLTVTDDGRGMAGNPGHGFGIANMRQRARTLGGSFVIARVGAAGTSVVWRVPLHG